MTSPRWTRVLLAPAAMLCWACSDSATNPTNPTEPSDKPADPVQPTISELIVSDVSTRIAGGTAASASAGAAGDVAYVSLPPGAIPNAVSARIRNVTAGGPTSEAIAVVDGGFDPVAVTGAENDQLELSFTRANGEVTTAYIKIPPRRPPVIVRTSPPKGRTDVPLSSRVAVVFSEPIDEGTITGIRLVRDGATVLARVERPVTSPWVVEVEPNEEMQPLTTYQVVITQSVRDLDGDAIPETETVPFTTGPRLPVSGQIAFASNREGPWNIYVANADGSGMVRLTAGERPSWSPDGRRIAFERGSRHEGWLPHGAAIYLINADGSGEIKLTDGMHPAWSPDGQRIAFVDSEGISLINVDGSGLTRLIRHDARFTSDPGLYSRAPAWSPDGSQIAFEYNRDPEDFYPQRIWVMKADGSDPRILTQYSNGDFAECNPAWSPDGTAILFWSFDLGLASQDPRRSGGATYIYGGPGLGCGAAAVWSPDGTTIALTTNDWNEALGWRRRIYLFHLAGRWREQLVGDVVAPANPTYSDGDVAWSRASR
jgi:Tol biopolymer transport system component